MKDFGKIVVIVNAGTGATVPGAIVNLKDLVTGGVRLAHTDAAGQFEFGSVPQGDYQAEAKARGLPWGHEAVRFVPRQNDRHVVEIVLGSPPTVAQSQVY